MEDETPGSLEDAKNFLFRRIWAWIRRQSLIVKLAAALVIVLVLIVLARLNVFGEPYFRYARAAAPWHIPVVDDDSRVIPISLSFETENEFGRLTGKRGGPCYSDDHIYLSFKVGLSSWVSVLSMDAKRIHGLLQNKRDPSLVESDKTYIIDFPLDDTTGNEVFYVIASSEPYTFETDIAPHLPRNSVLSGEKGPAKSSYQLTLPEMFAVKFTHCNHLSKRQ